MKKELTWIDTDDQLPPYGSNIICALLTEFVNAPWKWDFYSIYYRDGNDWGEYSRPNKWALIPEPDMPMNESHKKALKVHAKEKEYEREKALLDKKYGR